MRNCLKRTYLLFLNIKEAIVISDKQLHPV